MTTTKEIVIAMQFNVCVGHGRRYVCVPDVLRYIYEALAKGIDKEEILDKLTSALNEINSRVGE